MKGIVTSFFAVIIALFLSSAVAAQTTSIIYLFHGNGCPHCEAVIEEFEERGYFEKYPIQQKEVYFDRENARLFTTLLDELDVPLERRGVPTVVIGNEVLVGDTPILAGFEEKAETLIANNQVATPTQAEQSQNPAPLTLLAVVGASVVDAINPCAFAVLIILMSTVLGAGKARRVLQTGMAFSASIFISYLLMGLGVYRALGFGGISRMFFSVVGWLAIGLGLLNLKDYFWYGKGVLMEVPLSWRPKLKSLLQSVTSPAGAFGMGFLVSLFLLPCTSGPYIVILGMLAERAQFTQALGYLVLYNLIFVTPMVLITWAVYKGYDPNKAEALRQKQLRVLHLIAGVILLAMGVVMVAGLF